MIKTVGGTQRFGLAAAMAAVLVAVALTVDPQAGAVLGFSAAPPAINPPVQARPDADGDGLYDDDETDVYGTDSSNPDSDGDGADDGQEVYDGTNPLVPDASGVMTTPPTRTYQTTQSYQTTQTYQTTRTYQTTQTYETTQARECSGGGVWPDCLH